MNANLNLKTIMIISLCTACEPLADGKTGSDPNWGDNVGIVEHGSTVSGDLADGEIIDLAWAANSSVACWPTTEDVNFSGNHVFYATDIPPNSLLTATVSPDAGVDANVYIIEMGTTAYSVPPDVSSAVTCEAGYPQSTDSNPGEEDSASVNALNNPYNVLIGVAGSEGNTSGSYSLTISLEDY